MADGVSMQPRVPTLLDLTREAIIAGHDVEWLERAIVAGYCAEHDLRPQPGSPVADLISAVDPAALALYDDVTSWSLNDLVMAFETLVPQQEAKKYGAVFTPSAITNFMATESVRRWTSTPGHDLHTVTVLDPAVGCGAILVAALLAIAEKTLESPSAVARRLYGVDISENSVRRAHVLLHLTCLTMGDDEVPEPTLIVADSLTHHYERQFDVVLANPPYVRFQHLDPQTRTALAQRWTVCTRGNYNLYFPFFELAWSLVKEDGQACFITPNGYFTSFSAADLRTWMIAHDALDDVVDFGHNRVFEALTYTAIAFFSKTKDATRRGVFGYADVAGLDDLSTLSDTWTATRTEPIALSSLTAKPWRIAGPRTAKAVRAIGSTGRKLGAIAAIRYGIATCRDKVYLLSGETNANGNYTITQAGTVFEIEPGITRRCVKVSGLSDQTSLTNSRMRIIYPYTISAGRAQIMDEAVLAASFPKAYAYLCAMRQELEKRDKGQKVYASWFAYARTQGLIPLGMKLLTPLYADKPRFLTDQDPDALFINGCAVQLLPGSGEDVAFVQAILNSDVTRFYIRQTSNAIDGGYFAYQKSQLSGIGIPASTPEQRAAVLAAEGTEREDMIARLFGLTLADIPLPAANGEAGTE